MLQIPRRSVLQLYQIVSGRNLLTRLDELNRTQWLSGDELAVLQQKKLHQLFTYAHQWIPYYHQLFDAVDFQPDEILVDTSSIQKIPVLTKEIIRQNFDNLLTTEPKHRKQMSQLTTGGSTGYPLIFMQDSNFRDYVTADIHRHLGWGGWSLGQKHAYIWGANFEIEAADLLRTRLMNWVLNRFVTNAYVLTKESMSAFANKIQQEKPRILFGYPSSAYRFAKFVCEQGLDDIKFDAIFSSAEVLYPDQRQFIEATFHGKMFNRYGTRELGGICCECEAHTALHASVENVYIEILKSLRNGESAQLGETGHVVITNLNNYGMPFIRYQVEDMGAWSTLENCPCGRQLPLMDLVQGRRIDMFKTKDGRDVWGGFASPLFGIKGIERFQLIQKTLDDVLVRIVKNAKLDQAGLAKIERTIKTALGNDIQIEYEFPDEIAVYDSGKYRYVICKIAE